MDKTASHRPTVLGRRGMVAAGHPLASLVGINVLQAGGNAVDAAVATSAAVSVLMPQACGLGGDLFALVYTATDGRVAALNGSGAAPLAAGRLAEGGIPTRGLASATVPGAVAAWHDLAERFGSMKLGRLLEPALAYATEGFPVGAHLAAALQSYQELLQANPATARALLPEGRPRGFGELLTQPDLARSLGLIAREGAEAFYRGEIARGIVQAAAQHGGLFAAEDLSAHRSIWAEPVRTTYRGVEVLAQPPVSQGHVLLEALNVGELFDLSGLEPNGVECVHLMAEAMRLAFQDRARYLGDPDVVPVPVQWLVSKEHAQELQARLDRGRAQVGSAAATGGDTTYLAVVDGRGNAVSMIQSIFHVFGSGVVAEGTGVLLNNRMTGFSLDPNSPNYLRPGKRPAHTLNNCIVLRAGRPELVLGTPGADAQPQAVFQLLVDLLDFGMELQEAIEQPRWRIAAGRELLVEARMPAAVQEGLARLGHEVRTSKEWDGAMGGAQAIALSPEGTLQGAADPRREGYAIGW